MDGNDSSYTNALVARDSVSTSRFLDNKFWAMLDFICSEDPSNWRSYTLLLATRISR